MYNVFASWGEGVKEWKDPGVKRSWGAGSYSRIMGDLKKGGMFPLLANTHPASTPVSISGKQAPTKATAVLLPALGCPRVVPRNSVSYKGVVAAGASYCNLYHEAGTPGRRQTRTTTTTISLPGPPDAARGPLPPLTLIFFFVACSFECLLYSCIICLHAAYGPFSVSGTLLGTVFRFKSWKKGSLCNNDMHGISPHSRIRDKPWGLTLDTTWSDECRS